MRLYSATNSGKRLASPLCRGDLTSHVRNWEARASDATWTLRGPIGWDEGRADGVLFREADVDRSLSRATW